MKTIQLTFVLLILGLTGLWLAADDILSVPLGFFSLRGSLVQLTGILAIGAMSAGVILATRPVVVETRLGGLDKMYRLHKWLGIAALVFAVVHWGWSQAPKWLAPLGWFQRPARVPMAPETDPVLALLRSLRGPAEGLGEWAFYAGVVLIALALIKRFPYRWFFKTHRLLAVVYLVLAFHSVVLMKTAYWDEPIGIVSALLILAGSIAAVATLIGRVGSDRRAVGKIEALDLHPDLAVMKISVRLEDRWAGNRPGQFAFVTFHAAEGPHPFTIASAWTGDGRVDFLVKGLGDYTRTLPASLKVGDVVTVEGPYGRFDFQGARSRQIWIGGGIGITPFVARMKALALRPDGKSIDLFHTTTVFEADAIAALRRDAAAAGVRFHLLVDAEDGFLDVDRIRAAVPDWATADVWFCGPAGFGKALRRDFIAAGLSADAFHQEFFDMR